MSKILVADDEKDIAELISDILVDEGYEVIVVNNGNDALNLINSNYYDLILLDVMMPDISGTELCGQIRGKIDSPIIFITAKTSLVDKLVAFELGADDYITKPFAIEELVARVKAQLRRGKHALKNDANIIKIGNIEINRERYEVRKNDQIIELSTREFELLEYLMLNAGIVLSKEQIFENVWGSNYGEIGTVAVHIKSLRSKLDNDEEYIRTVWGLGYKFIKVVD